MQPVRLIFRKKAATLIEYQKDGIPVRVSVPSAKVFQTTNPAEAEVSEKTLREGIPYGVPWSIHIDDVTITGEDIENEFHKLGIWTVEDYRKNPGTVQSAIMTASASIVRSIVQTAKEYSTKEVLK